MRAVPKVCLNALCHTIHIIVTYHVHLITGFTVWAQTNNTDCGKSDQVSENSVSASTGVHAAGHLDDTVVAGHLDDTAVAGHLDDTAWELYVRIAYMAGTGWYM